MNRWWTADPHFNHANICKFCNRPVLKPGMLDEKERWVSNEVALACAQANNELLKRSYDSRIKDHDKVICVGDFSCKGGDRGVAGLRVPPHEILRSLKGSWTIVEGNHDKNNEVKTLCVFMIVTMGGYLVGVQHKPLEQIESAPFADVSEEVAIAVAKRRSHIEYCSSNLDFMICGHVHTAWRFQRRFGLLHFNVGVDVNKFLPLCDAEVITAVERHLKQETEALKE